MEIFPIKTRVFRENEDLFSFVCAHVRDLAEGSILAIASKIVALSEGRTAAISNDMEKEKLVRRESEWVLPGRYAHLTMKDGLLMANAGIDESNAGGKLILLPKDSFAEADALRGNLRKHYCVKNLGIVITDSHVMPNRAGIIGIALGYAGFRGIRDYRGKKDLFGRKMKITQLNIADSLATCAVLAMGEGRESQPLAVVEDAPVEFTNRRINKRELLIEIKNDLYRPLFRKAGQKSR